MFPSRKYVTQFEFICIRPIHARERRAARVNNKPSPKSGMLSEIKTGAKISLCF